MRSYHASFRYGLAGGVALVLLHLISTLFFTSTATQPIGGFNPMGAAGDWIMMFIQGLFYIGFARAAANAQYRFQVENVEEPLAGVQSEGMGAALVICVISWVFMIIRWFVMDASANHEVIADPLSLACNMGISGMLALALGGWSASRVVKKYRFMQDDDLS